MALALKVRRPTGMKYIPVAAFLAAAYVLRAGVPDGAIPADWNVNSRYTVESVNLNPRREYRLSDPVLGEMRRLIGARLDVEALDGLARRITEELRAQRVTFHVSRGNEREHVQVTFDVERRDGKFDVSLSGLTYNSREGWTGVGQASLTSGLNAFTVAGLSNGDDLVERYSGVRTRYERLNVGTPKVKLSFAFDTFREQWDPDTQAGSGAYRSRLNFEPSATFALAKPVTLTVGLSFESMSPETGGAREAANALVSGLRYHQRWGEGGEATSGDLEGLYRLRVATGLLGSDDGYTKHTVNARYTWKKSNQTAEIALLAGVIYGRAPLFERFVLGNSSTLRGWSKFDLDPLGGNRVMHASVTYGYHIMRVFYDTGAIWDGGRTPAEKHSVGVGLTTGLGLFGKNALLIALAFPIREGRVVPVVTAGMNF